MFQFRHNLRFRGTDCVSTDTFWRDFHHLRGGGRIGEKLTPLRNLATCAVTSCPRRPLPRGQPAPSPAGGDAAPTPVRGTEPQRTLGALAAVCLPGQLRGLGYELGY